MTPKLLFLRLFAYAFDFVVINLLQYGLLFLLAKYLNFSTNLITIGGTFITISFFYFLILEKIHYTLGQFIFGLIVISKDHNKNIPFLRVLVRAILKSSVFLIAFSVIISPFLKGKQLLHDYLANTKVIGRKEYYQSNL